MSEDQSRTSGGHELEVVESGFRVVFPAAPTRSERGMARGALTVPIVLHTAVFQGADFMIGVATYPPELLSDTTTVLEDGERAALTLAKSPTDVRSDDLAIPIPSVCCRRVTYREAGTDGVFVELRLCAHGEKFYTLGVFAPPGAELTSATREFFMSFELLNVVSGRKRSASAVFRPVSSLDLDCVPRTLTPLLGAKWHRIDHRAGYLLGRVDGHKTYGEIIGASGIDRDHGIQAFTELLQAGLVASGWRKAEK